MRAAVFLAVGGLFLACGDGEGPEATTTRAAPEPSTRTRPFQLGVSSQPVEATEESYGDAFAMAGDLGEVILIQRAPPWADFMPGGAVSPRTERLTNLERELAEENGLQLLLAIDPTLPSDRGSLAGLPPALEGAGFADPDLRAAFVHYAKYLALNYKPAYMAIGVEVDLIYRLRGETSFRNFLSLYFEAYDAVKEASPQTLVFPTFQYEDLLGILGNPPSEPAWSLVDRFRPRLDLLAVSTFPGAVFDAIQEMPGDYYDGLFGRFDEPVAFFSTGWSSESKHGTDQSSTQVAFLLRLFAAAERLKAPFLVWFLAQDPEAAAQNGTSRLATMGLYDADGKAKAILKVWKKNLSRPLP